MRVPSRSSRATPTPGSAPLTQVSIATSREAEEAVAELLLRIFQQTPSTYFDNETGETTVSTYLEKTAAWNAGARAEIQSGLRTLTECGIETAPGEITVRKVRREDWAESWKRHFKPLEIGTALLLKPSWEKRQPRPGQVVVILDPGLSFGTGHHATTSFCLGQLVAQRQAGARQSFLDIGTGSGILAIAAAKLGYSPVRCFDFDPESVRVAKANAAQNGVAERVKPVRRDLTKLPKAGATRHHVVCANLIYDLLIAERDRILSRLRPDGVLVLAGILQTQFARVQRAYRSGGMQLIATQVEKEWQSGAFIKAPAH